MITISASRDYRLSRKVRRLDLAALTQIEPTRLRDLELRNAEPWFDEALRIARAFGVSVHDLCRTDDMTAFNDDLRFFTVDLKFWCEGVRLPLSIAMRLQRRFGLPMVDDLDQSPLIRQLWSILECSERHPEAPGWCPWCQADIIGGDPHADHCLPHLLLGERAALGYETEAGTADPPRPGRKGSRKGSAKVPGLKALRERLLLTQVGMADKIGFNVNHYARVERCELPLVLPKADLICQLFNVSRDALFSAPEPEERPVGSPDNMAQ